MKYLALVCLFAFISYTQAQSLKCYQCENCSDLGDTKTSYCGPETTIAVSSTTPQTTGPTNPTETTLDQQSTTDTLQPTTSAPTSLELLQSYRAFSRSRRDSAEEGYFCYKIDVTVEGKTQLNRGCLFIPKDEKGCEILDKNINGSTSNCNICNYDGCNSSSMAQVSFFALLFVLIAKYVF